MKRKWFKTQKELCEFLKKNTGWNGGVTLDKRWFALRAK
jgi:hypothetical protein